MRSTAIVDSGPLIAVVNAADPHHDACLRVLQTPSFDLIIPVLCIAEAAYFLQTRCGPDVEARFLRSLNGFDLQAPVPREWIRLAELVERYSDFPLGATDASVVALAERYDTETVITLDRRHFSAIRPHHCDSFTILPTS